MKAIIEAKKYRDTDSSYIVVEIRFLCVPIFYYKKQWACLSIFTKAFIFPVIVRYAPWV